MKFTKTIICLFVFLLAGSALFALDNQSKYDVSFTYSALSKKGTGTSGEGIVPQIVIRMTDDSHADITIPRFAFSESKTIDTFVIHNVNVSKDKDGNTTYDLKSFESTDGKSKVKGTDLKATIKDGKIELYVEFKVAGMPFKLKVTYKSL